jgi:hypothetical protein
LHPLSEKNDLVAQLVEHLPFKERVLGSSPSPVTREVKEFVVFYRLFFILKSFLAENLIHEQFFVE